MNDLISYTEVMRRIQFIRAMPSLSSEEFNNGWHAACTAINEVVTHLYVGIDEYEGLKNPDS